MPTDAGPPLPGRRGKVLRFRPWLRGSLWGDVMEPRPLGGRVRAIRRITMAMLWTLVSMPIQAVLVALPGRANVTFGRFYNRTLCWLIGIRIQVVGDQARGGSVLFLSNHTSWLDILVLGGTIEAAFVAKAEVGEWPLVRTIARLGRTVFVSRKRGTTGREADAIRARLAGGDSLILFPEGTSNDGTRTLPFRSAFLGAAAGARLVQPVSNVYDRLGGLPACRRDRPLFAWYGDMEIGSHFWRIARRAGARATVLLHDPVDPALYADRKDLTQRVEAVVAAGASQLRQNRKPVPLSL